MNLPKLKWWHIGALVGLGIGLANLYFVVVVAASRAYFAGAGIFGILLELPVLPIFILVGFFFEGLSLYFGSTIVLILIHLISWILGGIFYAWIFRLITKHSRKNKKQLGFALPVAILIVVVLIVAGGAGYYFYKTSVDETAGWETYTNEKYGYSFKYPPECKYGVWTPEVLPTECFCFLNVKDPDDVLLELRYVSEKDKLVSAAFSVRHCSDSWDKESDSPCSPADFLIHNPPPGTELVSWLKENYKEGLNGDIPDKPNFEIDGIPAVNVLNEFPLDPPNERIFFIKNYRLFDITLWYVDSESNKELYNQILSTFKFIEIDETADWEVYQNEEYGFEIKYPVEMKEEETLYQGYEERGFCSIGEGCYTSLFSMGLSYSWEEPPFQKSPLDWNLDPKNYPICFGLFFVQVLEKPPPFSLGELKEKYKKSEYIIVDGVKGLRRNEFKGEPPGGGGNEDVVYLPKNSKLYLVRFIVDGMFFKENMESCVKGQTRIFNEMLSTFKFIEK